MLSPEGLTKALYKVKIIQDWLEPQKVKDVQSFLSFANFYCCFIYGYSKITIPLMCLTHKGTTWHFSNECCSAFEALKKGFYHSCGPYKPIGSQTLNLQWRLMLPTIHSLHSFQ